LPISKVVIKPDKLRDKKTDLEVIYTNIRNIDKKIIAFKIRIQELKYVISDDPDINALQRDIWDMEQKRKELLDIFRGHSDEQIINKDVIIMSIADVMDYTGLLANDNLKRNKYKILQILRKVHCKGIDRYHDWLDDLKEDMLKKCMECE